MAPIGGALEPPRPSPLPQEIKEGVISDPMFLYRTCYLVYLGVTCKKSARNLEIWSRFQDFKILQNWDITSPWLYHKPFHFADSWLIFYIFRNMRKGRINTYGQKMSWGRISKRRKPNIKGFYGRCPAVRGRQNVKISVCVSVCVCVCMCHDTSIDV